MSEINSFAKFGKNIVQIIAINNPYCKVKYIKYNITRWVLQYKLEKLTDSDKVKIL